MYGNELRKMGGFVLTDISLVGGQVVYVVIIVTDTG